MDKRPERLVHGNPARRRRDKLGDREPKDIKDLQKRIRCVSRASFWLNVIFFVFSIVICGGGIYLLSDKIIILYMLDDNLLLISCWIIILASGLMIITSMLGGLAAILMRRYLLLIYVAIVTLIIIMLSLAGIMALNIQFQFGDWAKMKMLETLKWYYGVDQDNIYNIHVTRAWDTGQRYMACCGVSGDFSWQIYRTTRWYIDRPGFENIIYQNEPTVKLFVPASCCTVDDAGHYVNLTKCQQFEDGPPALRYGEFNEGLHYKDCYTAITDWMHKYSTWITSLGLTAATLIVSGLILAAYSLVLIPRHYKT